MFNLQLEKPYVNPFRPEKAVAAYASLSDGQIAKKISYHWKQGRIAFWIAVAMILVFVALDLWVRHIPQMEIAFQSALIVILVVCWIFFTEKVALLLAIQRTRQQATDKANGTTLQGQPSPTETP